MLACAVLVAACAGDEDGDGDAGSWVADIEAAMNAVDDERDGAQDYFEVTANPQLTNVFVAVDGATAAVPYVFVDGELQPPAPPLEGASGFTFTAADVDIDEPRVLSQVEAEVPGATIVALSVEGGSVESGSAVRYVVSAQSDRGGFLDITVSGDGRILAVDPL